jgi:hypothetical protein
VTYKRAKNLVNILDTCRISGVRRIYFAVDGPSTSIDVESVQAVKDVIRDYATRADFEIKVRILEENAGCAVAVLTAIDWFFKEEEFGIILEDDCIPSKNFFDFMRDAIPLIGATPDIWLASGTQFFPDHLEDRGWIKSRYPMHWGWGTSASAWSESRSQIEVNPPTKRKFLRSIQNPELVYWFAGERRAFYGFTDVWDSIYASNMFRARKFAIVPSTNLVTNIGNDSLATNTIGEREYTQRGFGEYLKVQALPQHLESYDKLVKTRFFRISGRHYLTTLYTMLLDYLIVSRKKFPHLDSRLIHFSGDK